MADAALARATSVTRVAWTAAPRAARGSVAPASAILGAVFPSIACRAGSSSSWTSPCLQRRTCWRCCGEACRRGACVPSSNEPSTSSVDSAVSSTRATSGFVARNKDSAGVGAWAAMSSAFAVAVAARVVAVRTAASIPRGRSSRRAVGVERKQWSGTNWHGALGSACSGGGEASSPATPLVLTHASTKRTRNDRNFVLQRWCWPRPSAASSVGNRCCATTSGFAGGSQPRRPTRGTLVRAVSTVRIENEDMFDGEDEVEAASSERVRRSMELLQHYSEKNHPGHEPGRFAGMGPEYDGMEFDGLRWHLKKEEAGQDASSTALAKLSDDDRVLVTKFESEGGLALTLGNSFKLPDRLRKEARRLVSDLPPRGTDDTTKEAWKKEAEPSPEEAESWQKLEDEAVQVLEQCGLGAAKNLFKGASRVDRAVLFFQAADATEEREAVMRNVWSDVEFQAGDVGNAELVSRLEMQFAGQLVRTTEARLEAEAEAKRERERAEDTAEQGPEASLEKGAGGAVESSAATSDARQNDDDGGDDDDDPSEEDGIFEIALRGSAAESLAQSLSTRQLTETLREPRNLGVALDLVGVYLKNYEIDKADLVINRVVPLARERGGTWLVKALDKMSAVRMKQFRAYDALVALKEIEQVVPFAPEEGWEFHDILYRNLAWCYSALDEPERCLEYTSKSVEVKKASGVPASWFDIWDLGKGHARLGQKTKQRDEMVVAYNLCVKAGEIHREAEASDRIMLAKILSNIGEVAMGIGDSYYEDGNETKAQEWYKKAEPSLVESYELHSGALGPMKPLSGWAAGTVAHCMVRLRRLEDARDYLRLALKVECTKDSTTPGSVIELLDRVMGVHQQLGDMQAMEECSADLYQALDGLRTRGWDRKERDVFALLLQRVATAILSSDDGSGRTIPKALDLLREAESSLGIHIGASFSCERCGKRYAQQADLEAHMKRRHKVDGARDAVDVEPKQFGPHEDPEELLRQLRSSIQVLEVAERAGNDKSAATETASRWKVFLSEAEAAAEAKAPLDAVRKPSPWLDNSTSESNLDLDELMGKGVATLSGFAEPDDMALSRSYSLVGSWNDWSSFTPLSPEAEGSSMHTAEVQVPIGKRIEFQLVCDGDWKRRLFPSRNGQSIMGPSSSGHGQNWRLAAPSEPLTLRVRFDPTGTRQLECILVAVSAAPQAKPVESVMSSDPSP